MTSYISFARRQNRDSSIDSICTKCYQTIANGESVKDLKIHEEAHLCDPNAEADRKQMVFSDQHYASRSR